MNTTITRLDNLNEKAAAVAAAVGAPSDASLTLLVTAVNAAFSAAEHRFPELRRRPGDHMLAETRLQRLTHRLVLWRREQRATLLIKGISLRAQQAAARTEELVARATKIGRAWVAFQAARQDLQRAQSGHHVQVRAAMVQHSQERHLESVA